MEWTLKSDGEILEKVGERLSTLRLSRNMLQKDMAEWAGISLTTVQRVEGGKPISTLHLIKVLRSIDMLEKLGLLFPEPLPSPIQLKKLQGKTRKRASKKK